MKYATLDNDGAIDGLFSGPQSFETTEVPDQVQMGWSFANGAWTAPPPTPAELLTAARGRMADLFDNLTLEVQAEYYGARIRVETALDRNLVDLARAILQALTVPAELEDSRAAMLAELPA